MTHPDLDLAWSLAKSADGKLLHITYSLKNKSEQKIYVADQLLAYHAGKIQRVPTRMIVSSDRQPGLVRFFPPSSAPARRSLITPRSHCAGAGATHQGSAELETSPARLAQLRATAIAAGKTDGRGAGDHT